MSAAAPAPGFYGKMPAAGDFVTRRLPRSFVQPFDRWISAGLSRRPPETAGGAAWRFTLPAGALGPDPVVGVWRLSPDRAGRVFALVIASPGCTGKPGEDWYERLADLADEAAEGALEPARLEALLEALPPVAATPGAAEATFWCDTLAPFAVAPDRMADALTAMLDPFQHLERDPAR